MVFNDPPGNHSHLPLKHCGFSHQTHEEYKRYAHGFGWPSSILGLSKVEHSQPSRDTNRPPSLNENHGTRGCCRGPSKKRPRSAQTQAACRRLTCISGYFLAPEKLVGACRRVTAIPLADRSLLKRSLPLLAPRVRSCSPLLHAQTE